MSMTTVSADASQSIFEFLHSELVSYLQEVPPGSDKVTYLLPRAVVCDVFLVFKLSSQLRSPHRLMLSRSLSRWGTGLGRDSWKEFQETLQGLRTN
jgi:hypothetical protein